MAIKLTSTRSAARVNGAKILVYGQAGAGKTVLCATTNEPTVIISAESGLMSLRSVDIPVIEVSTLNDVYEAYQFIAESEEAKDFRWVCLDSISEIAEVVLANEKKSAKDPRMAYGALSDKMFELLRAFRDLPGRNIYMSAKMDRQKDEQTGGMIYGPAMPGAKLGLGIPYLFDEVFVLRAEKADDGNVYRTLQTGQDYQYIAKDRSGVLDMFEEPNLASIVSKIVKEQ